jgi:hypothetical protein
MQVGRRKGGVSEGKEAQVWEGGRLER